MNSQRLAITGAITVTVVCLLYVLAWWLLWPLLAASAMPTALLLLPVNAFGCLLAAAGLLCAAFGARPRYVRGLAAAVMALAVLVLCQYLFRMDGGIERMLFGEPARMLFSGAHPGRPAPQAALTFLFIGIALWFAAPPQPRFELADIAAGGATFVSFTAVLGHLYQAQELYGASAGLSLVGAMLLLTLAVGALSLNPLGVLAAYRANDTAGAARRRLLPVVVLTPILLGLFQSIAVRTGWLEFSLALALAVTASIVLFIVFIEWVSRLLVKIESERSGVMRQRETRAKEEGMTDMLTGLLNRRGWDQCMAAGEARCQRENLNACVIAIDLDGLKQINDTEGHAKGDDLLKRAGHALKTAARREDFLARLGGDEFAYLAIGVGPEHAEAVIKRLAGTLAAARVLASLGHAMRDLSGNLAAAYQEADQQMYANKRARKAQTAKLFTQTMS